MELGWDRDGEEDKRRVGLGWAGKRREEEGRGIGGGWNKDGMQTGLGVQSEPLQPHRQLPPERGKKPSIRTGDGHPSSGRVAEHPEHFRRCSASGALVSFLQCQ